MIMSKQEVMLEKLRIEGEPALREVLESDLFDVMPDLEVRMEDLLYALEETAKDFQSTDEYCLHYPRDYPSGEHGTVHSLLESYGGHLDHVFFMLIAHAIQTKGEK